MKFGVKFDDFPGAQLQQYDQLEKDATEEADIVQKGLTQELRNQVLSAGMGPRLAKSWQGTRYPNHPSLGAAAFVHSKAPEIIDAFDRGAVIHPINGRRFLAIPTENTPRGRNGPMTPAEVEQAYGKLEFQTTRKGTIIAFVQAVGALSGKGFRSATVGRAKQGRKAQAVVMFYLVPAVRLPKRFDVDSAANHWADEFVNGLRERWSAS